MADQRITRVRTYRGRWVVTLACGHRIRLDQTLSKPVVGATLRCPEDPIVVVYPDENKERV